MRREILGKIRVRPTAAVGAVLLVLALLGLTTDVFRSSRSILRDAIGDLRDLGSRRLELQIAIDPPEKRGGQRLTLTSGGVLVVPDDAPLALDGAGDVRVRKKGLELIFRFAVRLASGTLYWKFDELPATPEITERVEGRWLQLTDPRDDPGVLLPGVFWKDLGKRASDGAVIERIERQERERIEGVSARKYRVVLREEAARELAQALSEETDHPGVRATAGRVSGILRHFHVDTLELWITPRTHDLVRVHLVLVPKAEALSGSRVQGTLTLTPLSEAPTVEVPERSVRFRRPDLLFRLFGLGLGSR